MRRLTGVAPQELALYQTVTVRENLRLFGGLAGLRGRALDAAISRVLEVLALGPVAGKRTGELSGGQRRRVQAAGAAVLYTTHYLPELTDLNATLAIVRAGRVIARGTQEELTWQHTVDDLYWSLAVSAPEGESDAVA